MPAKYQTPCRHACTGKHMLARARILLALGAVDHSRFRRLVSRACTVCEWEGQAVESANSAVDCPWCHAPSRIVREELLVPIVVGKHPIAAALSRLGAAAG